MASVAWSPDPQASFVRRLGIAPTEPGSGGDDDETASGGQGGCPDVWELDNGDVVVIGRDLTENYAGLLPSGVSVGAGERLVVIPRGMARAVRMDSPDA